tara:strand:+ start:100 stop:411 length:312 start_codon:yes stop_codon:yes gene_type:complete
VISRRQTKSNAKKGIDALYKRMMVFLNRKLAMKRLRPMGGVEYPISKFVRKMMPKWIGWISYAWAKGRTRGTTKMRAENMSTRHPTARRKKLSAISRIHFESI